MLIFVFLATMLAVESNTGPYCSTLSDFTQSQLPTLDCSYYAHPCNTCECGQYYSVYGSSSVALDTCLDQVSNAFDMVRSETCHPNRTISIHVENDTMTQVTLLLDGGEEESLVANTTFWSVDYTTSSTSLRFKLSIDNGNVTTYPISNLDCVEDGFYVLQPNVSCTNETLVFCLDSLDACPRFSTFPGLCQSPNDMRYLMSYRNSPTDVVDTNVDIYSISHVPVTFILHANDSCVAPQLVISSSNVCESCSGSQLYTMTQFNATSYSYTFDLLPGVQHSYRYTCNDQIDCERNITLSETEYLSGRRVFDTYDVCDEHIRECRPDYTTVGCNDTLFCERQSVCDVSSQDCCTPCNFTTCTMPLLIRENLYRRSEIFGNVAFLEVQNDTFQVVRYQSHPLECGTTNVPQIDLFTVTSTNSGMSFVNASLQSAFPSPQNSAVTVYPVFEDFSFGNEPATNQSFVQPVREATTCVMRLGSRDHIYSSYPHVVVYVLAYDQFGNNINSSDATVFLNDGSAQSAFSFRANESGMSASFNHTVHDYSVQRVLHVHASVNGLACDGAADVTVVADYDLATPNIPSIHTFYSYDEEGQSRPSSLRIGDTMFYRLHGNTGNYSHTSFAVKLYWDSSVCTPVTCGMDCVLSDTDGAYSISMARMDASQSYVYYSRTTRHSSVQSTEVYMGNVQFTASGSGVCVTSLEVVSYLGGTVHGDSQNDYSISTIGHASLSPISIAQDVAVSAITYPVQNMPFVYAPTLGVPLHLDFEILALHAFGTSSVFQTYIFVNDTAGDLVSRNFVFGNGTITTLLNYSVIIIEAVTISVQDVELNRMCNGEYQGTRIQVLYNNSFDITSILYNMIESSNMSVLSIGQTPGIAYAKGIQEGVSVLSFPFNSQSVEVTVSDTPVTATHYSSVPIVNVYADTNMNVLLNHVLRNETSIARILTFGTFDDGTNFVDNSYQVHVSQLTSSHIMYDQFMRVFAVSSGASSGCYTYNVMSCHGNITGYVSVDLPTLESLQLSVTYDVLSPMNNEASRIYPSASDIHVHGTYSDGSVVHLHADISYVITDPQCIDVLGSTLTVSSACRTYSVNVSAVVGEITSDVTTLTINWLSTIDVIMSYNNSDEFTPFDPSIHQTRIQDCNGAFHPLRIDVNGTLTNDETVALLPSEYTLTTSGSSTFSDQVLIINQPGLFEFTVNTSATFLNLSVSVSAVDEEDFWNPHWHLLEEILLYLRMVFQMFFRSR